MVQWSHPVAHRRLSMTGIAPPLMNGSVEPSGSSQGNGSDVDNLRAQYLELSLVWYSDSKISAVEVNPDNFEFLS